METVNVIPTKCLWFPGGKAAHLKQRIDDSLVFLGAEIAERLREANILIDRNSIASNSETTYESGRPYPTVQFCQK